MTKQQAIREAVVNFNYEWPVGLWTGVMFYAGYRITKEEFEACLVKPN